MKPLPLDANLKLKKEKFIFFATPHSNNPPLD